LRVSIFGNLLQVYRGIYGLRWWYFWGLLFYFSGGGFIQYMSDVFGFTQNDNLTSLLFGCAFGIGWGIFFSSFWKLIFNALRKGNIKYW